jgi:PAS domain S-box-containing protein
MVNKSVSERIVNLKSLISNLQNDSDIIRKLLDELDGIQTEISNSTVKNINVEEALKESEKKLSLIAQNINDIIWICDVQGKFTYFSPSANKWLGYTQDEIDMLNIADILMPEYKEKARQQFIKRLEDENNGIKTTDTEFIVPIVTKDGRIVPSEIKASPLRDSSNKYIGLVGVTRDATLRVQAEKNLLESEKQLKETIAAKDKFLSIIAHDLKSPFSALVGLTEVLKDRHDTMNFESRNEIIKSIYNSSLRTYNLLENLLAWTAIHTGRKNIDAVKFEIEEIIAVNIELLNEEIKRKQIEIIFNKKHRTFVLADRDMINTVIRNLLSNALKYTFNQSKIEVKVSPFDNSMVKITVKDSGIGISKSNIEKLFKIDSNFSTPGLENEKGTGLGLILCKEFVEKNKGAIWVSTIPGNGSEFCFTLPSGQ